MVPTMVVLDLFLCDSSLIDHLTTKAQTVKHAA